MKDTFVHVDVTFVLCLPHMGTGRLFVHQGSEGTTPFNVATEKKEARGHAGPSGRATGSAPPGLEWFLVKIL